jgi:transposase
MTPTFHIGIDVSKATLDVALLKDGTLLFTTKISNTEVAIKDLLASLKTEYKSTSHNTIFCAENMGIYNKFLVDVLLSESARFCLESPLQIKLSLGIQRAKNDRLDAIRIAEYALKNNATLKYWMPPRPPIQKLKTLMSIRRKLIKMAGMLKSSKKMELYFLSEASRNEIAQYSQATFTAIKADIRAINKHVRTTIKLDPNLQHLLKIITSVPHIGHVIATELLITTNEFRDFTCAKKFASYCGIAPFAKTSGTSLIKRPRVSHVANKDMKALLHIASLGAAKHKQTKFKEYYVRKVIEGKNKMSVLNAIRNKLVAVIFACVRDNKLYQDVDQTGSSLPFSTSLRRTKVQKTSDQISLTVLNGGNTN